jgi:hypothetical protein
MKSQFKSTLYTTCSCNSSSLNSIDSTKRSVYVSCKVNNPHVDNQEYFCIMKWTADESLNCVVLCCLQTLVQQTSIVQKFGNTRMTPSTLGGHEGKYTPSSSVPDLVVQRYVLHINFP